MWFRCRVRWDELVKVLEQMTQVCWRADERLPGRERDIQRTCEVRRVTPKYLWQPAHRRTETLYIIYLPTPNACHPPIHKAPMVPQIHPFRARLALSPGVSHKNTNKLTKNTNKSLQKQIQSSFSDAPICAGAVNPKDKQFPHHKGSSLPGPSPPDLHSTHSDTQLRRVKDGAHRAGYQPSRFLETRLKAGKVQSVAPTQGIPPPLPPANLPTAHSGLHSLGGSKSAISPSHLMGGHLMGASF